MLYIVNYLFKIDQKIHFKDLPSNKLKFFQQKNSMSQKIFLINKHFSKLNLLKIIQK